VNSAPHPGAVTADVREPTRAQPPAAHLRRLVVRDFRNIARAALEVPQTGFVLVGQNGHGKTNLLEAVHYAHALRSVRATRDRDLVRFGAEAFHLAFQATGARHDDIRIGVERATGRKRIVLDGVEVSRQADALGALPSVLLSPRDVVLVEGAPAERRRFLDITLATTSPRYIASLQRYRAALAQRNAALRDAAGRGDGGRIAVWEPALAEEGAVLWRARAEWVEWARPRLSELCAAIGERLPVSLRYVTSGREGDSHDMTEEALRERLASVLASDRASDLRRGMTQHGPHRDDLALGLGSKSLRTFGSAGQQRTAATALRLLERDTLRDRLQRSPILLLDDPFAELDRERSGRILSLLGDALGGQTMLAVPKADDVPDGFTGLTRWTIDEGRIDG
jgi:DNA replication and repair protein RecF